MAYTLDAATQDVLDRLSDAEEKLWTRAEIKLYVQDGYDEFCRRTKALFDVHVIENLPPTGNWQTDLERYFALQRPGWGLTDEPFHYTGNEQNYGTGGAVGGSYGPGPAGITNPPQRAFADSVDGNAGGVPTQVPGGTLPETTLQVIRVTYDQRDLVGLGSQQARLLDPNYLTRSGDPQFFLYDKDGINFLRLIPNATGDADYDTVSGSFGTMTYTDDTDVTAVTTEVTGVTTGGYGILRHRTGEFPAGGPWGTPTRIHPDTENIKVEVIRLGRNFTTHPCELPSPYQKYITYWAMAQALHRDGPGQSTELAAHFRERFEMGVMRLSRHVNMMSPERVGKFGQAAKPDPFGLGMPQAPYPYGIVREI
jgi:hypothetical protein